ncbi:MAG: hypothetical protein ACRYG7_41130 [Janthinobacterium lividum]
MTFDAFRLLSPRAQLLVVLLEGTYLAQRWEDENGFNLYYLPDEARGFFAEVGIDEAQDCFVVLRSFSSPVPLADYAQGMQLPEEWV